MKSKLMHKKHLEKCLKYNEYSKTVGYFYFLSCSCDIYNHISISYNIYHIYISYILYIAHIYFIYNIYHIYIHTHTHYIYSENHL